MLIHFRHSYTHALNTDSTIYIYAQVAYVPLVPRLRPARPVCCSSCPGSARPSERGTAAYHGPMRAASIAWYNVSSIVYII